MKLSIIIPVYNQEELVIKALDSIPTRNDVEIIIIDDKSTDKTYQNLLRYMVNNENKNILLLQNEKNIGAGATRNKGMKKAIGEYVMFLDSDDYLYPYLDRFMNELTGEDIVYYGLITNNGTKIMPKPTNIINLCGTVKAVRRKFIGESRFADTNFAEDWHFNKSLLDKNPAKKFTDIYLLHYNSPRKNSLFDLAIRKNRKVKK